MSRSEVVHLPFKPGSISKSFELKPKSLKRGVVVINHQKRTQSPAWEPTPRYRDHKVRGPDHYQGVRDHDESTARHPISPSLTHKAVNPSGRLDTPPVDPPRAPLKPLTAGVGADSVNDTRTTPEISCPECKHARFGDQASLHRHMFKQHRRPFVCVFSFAGCDSTFASKNEWKRHVMSQHLLLNYWLCTQDACAKNTNSSKASAPPATKDAVGSPPLPNGAIFNRKDLFLQHVRRMHTPPTIKKQQKAAGVAFGSQGFPHYKSTSQAADLRDWDEHVALLAKDGLRERCKLPSHMSCPAAGCSSVFTGQDAWDQRMEHLARHLEAIARGEEPAVEFGRDHDPTLMQWATRRDVAVVSPSPGGDGTWVLNNPLRPKTVLGASAVLAGHPPILRDSISTQPNEPHTTPAKESSEGVTGDAGALPSPRGPPEVEDAVSKRAEMVERVVQALIHWFARGRHQSARQAAQKTAAPASQQATAPPNQSGTADGARQNGSTAAQRVLKRGADELESDGEGEGDDLRRPPSKRAKGKSVDKAKFACPYLKHNPAKYGDLKSWKSCCGPGWDNVHRVKEHLYRRHRRPEFQCRRCYQTFRDAQVLDEHVRLQERCLEQPPAPLEGFGLVQESHLRRRAAANMGEVAKWKECYTILFSPASEHEIPDPFFGEDYQSDAPEPAHQCLKPCCSSNPLAEYEHYLAQELTAKLRQDLNKDLEKELDIREEEVQRRAIRIFKIFSRELFRDFFRSPRLSVPASDSLGDGRSEEEPMEANNSGGPFHIGSSSPSGTPPQQQRASPPAPAPPASLQTNGYSLANPAPGGSGPGPGPSAQMEDIFYDYMLYNWDIDNVFRDTAHFPDSAPSVGLPVGL